MPNIGNFMIFKTPQIYLTLLTSLFFTSGIMSCLNLNQSDLKKIGRNSVSPIKSLSSMLVTSSLFNDACVTRGYVSVVNKISCLL